MRLLLVESDELLGILGDEGYRVDVTALVREADKRMAKKKDSLGLSWPRNA